VRIEAREARIEEKVKKERVEAVASTLFASRGVFLS
jgi:hypothetical protein